MGHKPYKGFEPKWYTEVAPSDSYRNHFKWGDPTFNKPPKEGLYKLVKKTFDLTDDDFKEWHYLGLEKVITWQLTTTAASACATAKPCSTYSGFATE